ncbi:MAG: hypothetical protein LW857_04920 [Verrucomicrobiae bacterium]|nr:hypothetical protein [Verrucomicrobiae bacterium]
MKFCAAPLACLLLPWVGLAAPSAAELEFFEYKIRPVLVAECYEAEKPSHTIHHPRA